MTRQSARSMDADGIFASYTLDTLHYVGVNMYSLRLVATDGRLRCRASRRNTAPESGCDKCRFPPLTTSVPIHLPRYFRVLRTIERNKQKTDYKC